MARLLVVLVVLLRALRPLPSSASGNGECGRPHLPPSSLSIGSLRTPFSLIGRRCPRLSRFHWLALRAAHEHPENGRRGSPNDGVPHRGVPPMTGFLSARPPRPAGSLVRCPPEKFHCAVLRDPQTDCYPLEWLCDGHPDCDDERDELDCGGIGSTAVPTAGDTGTAGPFWGGWPWSPGWAGSPSAQYLRCGVRRGTGFTVQPGGSSV